MWFPRLTLRLLQALDRVRRARLQRRHPGIDFHPEASTNFVHARFDLAPGARLTIGRGAVTERRRERVHFRIGEGAHVRIEAGAWISGDVQPVHIACFAGAELTLGARSWLNGCHVSAKSRVRVGPDSWIGLGSRVFDSDQHPLDEAHPEQTKPVEIGAFVWVAADVTILKGVEIGDHSVIGTRSLVNRSLAPHTLAFGSPARAHGTVGDRSAAVKPGA